MGQARTLTAHIPVVYYVFLIFLSEKKKGAVPMACYYLLNYKIENIFKDIKDIFIRKGNNMPVPK